ncbi:N-acetylmuramoyl-L-alanine amidase LytC precursor [Oxobacter pfennigii]|uniref:N-acetylmuramoyl-L-alanine amidase LytC n=1 Tax=Oxobacter pfennigii TaxID=36849 RepID=A0A0P8X1U7_9CLOT|nr:immunoglobulin-like domain-containing protein [Oxobacter pfennigii]KPU44786.1 N-acetylmuramoyl-L-alanine amidase LytC precursor [Oxobacter pfennigii]
MKLKLKKMLSMFLVLCLVMALVPASITTAMAAENDVCEIDGISYGTLGEALAARTAVTTPTTITLLDDIEYSVAIAVDGKDITFELNGHTLNVNAAGTALEVTNGANVALTGTGEFNVTGTAYGVKAADGATAVVTNATAEGGTGAYAEAGGEITVNGDAEGYAMGAYSNGADSTVFILGDAIATGIGNSGVKAAAGGSITIGKDVEGISYGTYAEGTGSVITVTGNVKASGASGTGAYAEDGGKITIDGTVTANNYIMVDNISKNQEDCEATSNNPGYLTYTGGTSTVWVKEIISRFITDIDIAAPPKLIYTEGETLDLSDLIVTLTYSDGSTMNVAYEDFVYMGITASPDHEAPLSAATHHNQPVAVTYGTYAAYTDNLTVTAASSGNICQVVGGSSYTSLAAALAEVPDNTPTTIILLEDIDHLIADNNGLVISEKELILDLNENTLNISNTLGPGLVIQNTSDVNVTGQGLLTIASKGPGLSVSQCAFTTSADTAVNICSDDDVGVSANGSTVMLNGNVTGDTAGIYADSDNTITVSGTVTSTTAGTFFNHAVWLQNTGNTVNVGNAVVSSGQGAGIFISQNGGGDVTVGSETAPGQVTGQSDGIWTQTVTEPSTVTVYGDVQGVLRGLFVTDDCDIKIYGDVSSTSPNADSYGVYGFYNSSNDTGGILVEGDVQGVNGIFVHGGQVEASVGGNVTASGSSIDDNTGAYASYAKLYISGSVTAAGCTGVCSFENSEITVDGTVSAANYVRIKYEDKAAGDNDTSSTNPGYLQYSSGDAFAWIKDNLPPTGAAVWSYRSPLPAPNIMENAIFINGKYMAVGYSGTLITSPDGITWQKVDVGTDTDRLTDIAYGNGKYVIAATAGDYVARIYTSEDGLSWNETAAVPHHWLYGVTYGDDGFVAVGKAGKILRSDDGENWDVITVNPMRFTLLSVVYADGKYVAAGMGSQSNYPKGGIMTSDDGETWTETHTHSAYTLWDITNGRGTFVAVGGASSGSYYICTSPDGVTWTQRSSFGSSYAQLLSVNYDSGIGRFIAVGSTNSGGSSGSNKAFITTSFDGISWTDRSDATKTGFRVVVIDANDSEYVAMGGAGDIYTSDDRGVSWDYRTYGTTKALRDVAWNGSGLFVAVGLGGAIQTSSDGVTWTIQTSGTNSDLNKVDYLNNQFIAVGKNGTILTSGNGTEWTARTSGTLRELKGISYDGSRYVVVGGDDSYIPDSPKPIIITSQVGTAWIPATHDSNIPFRTVAHGNGIFIALTEYGRVYKSEDGTSWSAIGYLGSIGTQYPMDMIYAGSKFIAVGGYGEIYLSTDNGASWTTIESDLVGYLRAVTYGGGNFVAAGENGNIIASADGGTTWLLQPSGLTPNPYFNLHDDAELYGVVAGGGSFVAVGYNGVTLQTESFSISNDADAHDVTIAKSRLIIGNILGSGSNYNEDNIVANMNLVTSWAQDTIISWCSSKPEYIAENGTVTRPSFGTGDRVVYLTATISKGSASDTKTFMVNVIAHPDPDIQIAEQAVAALTFNVVKGDNTAENNIRSHLNLITDGDNGTSVSWTSNKPQYIDATTGAVTRPTEGTSDQAVTLTATVTKGAVTRTRNFYLTVKVQLSPDAQAVADDSEALTFEAIRGSNTFSSSIMYNLNLITSGVNETTISWSSDNQCIDPATGMVIRPVGDSNEPVTLTATISKGSASTTKTFYLAVKSWYIGNVAAITINSQPDDLTYIAGEPLDLTGLAVTLTYNDDTSLNVGYDDFIYMGVDVSPEHGATLTVADHHGKPVVVTCNGQSADTENLTVTEISGDNACTIGTIGYATLDAALAAVDPGETATIRLLTDITYIGELVIDDKTIVFDLGNHDLTIDNSANAGSGTGLSVTGGHVSISPASTGSLFVTGWKLGVYVKGTGSTGSASAAVTGAAATGMGPISTGPGPSGSYGCYAEEGGNIVVNGNVIGNYGGVDADGRGVTGGEPVRSSVTVNGNVTTPLYDPDPDPRNSFGGTFAVSAGLYGSVTVNGSVRGYTGIYSSSNYSTIVVNGNVVGSRGIYCSNVGSSVQVTGNVTAERTGVQVGGGANVVIAGNVTAGQWGAMANNGIITIEGTLTAPGLQYARINNSTKGINDYITEGSYYRYGGVIGGTSHIVRVKGTVDYGPALTNPGYPTVQTNAVTDVTPTSATLSGNVISDGGEQVIWRGFIYGTSPDITTPSVLRARTLVVAEGGGAGPFIYVLTGLTPGTTYYVSAYGKSNQGSSTIGTTSDVSFTTPLSLTDEGKVAADKAALTFDVIKRSNTAGDNIVSDLNLITSGANETTISWASNSNYIAANGTVTRPAQGAIDETVTLTATISKGSFSDTKPFTLTVKAKTVLDVDGIAIKTQPADLTYTAGESLDLTGLVVTLTYNDQSTLDVGYEDFTYIDITANPPHGATLSVSAHNNRPVTITCNGKTTTTGNLTVTSSGNSGNQGNSGGGSTPPVRPANPIEEAISNAINENQEQVDITVTEDTSEVLLSEQALSDIRSNNISLNLQYSGLQLEVPSSSIPGTENEGDISINAAPISDTNVLDTLYVMAPDGRAVGIGYNVDINRIVNGNTEPITQLNDNITLTFNLSQEDVEGIDPASLRVYKLDEATGNLVELGGEYLPDQNAVRVSTNHLCKFIIMGNTANERLYGSDRYGTAAAISRKGWDKSDNIILASGEDYPDALTGVVLAGLYDAPVLLTGKDSLNNEALKEIERLKAKKIYIIGGPGAISENIELKLKVNYDVERIYGSDRYKTAIAAGSKGRQAKMTDTAILATGLDFPDAMAIAPFAAKEGTPILYTSKDSLNTDTEKALKDWKIKKVILTGGTGVISAAVENYVRSNLNIQVIRLGGSDRYLTSLEIAKYYGQIYDYEGIVIATGGLFADALAGGALAVRENCPVLLVRRDEISGDMLKYISSLKMKKYYILGGPGAVSDGIKKNIK